MKNIFLFLLITASLVACFPPDASDIDLGPTPVSDFSFTYVPGDSNRVVVTATPSQDVFTFLWDFGNNGVPKNSRLTTDTVTFFRKGDYPITLHVSAKGGTESNTKLVNVPSSAGTNFCSDSTYIRLLGGCALGDTAAWIFSQEAGAIGVGPTPGSTEWFSSPAGSLDPEQYNDEWVFAVDDFRFQYYNQGLTVDPAAGYDAVPYDPPTNVAWSVLPGAGVNGEYRIALPSGSFIGTLDSGPNYDIVSITENRMVLHAEFVNGGGWFQFILEKKQ